MPVRIEAVNGLDETDRGNGHKVIQFHLRAPPIKALSKKLYLRHMRKNQLFTMGWCHHGEFLLGRREAAYAAAPSVDSAFDARSSRAMRCARISVADFFVPSLATYSRVWISPTI